MTTSRTKVLASSKATRAELEDLFDQIPGGSQDEKKESVRDYISDLESELQEADNEIDTLETEVEGADEKDAELTAVEGERDDLEQKLDGAITTDNLYDVQKMEVCKRLMKNMTLGNIEYLESLAKNMITNYKMD